MVVMRKDEPPCSSSSQQKLCGHSLKSHRNMQQHFILNQPEGGAKFKLKSCIKDFYGHSESEFLFNVFQLVSLLALGFCPTPACLSDSFQRERGANTAVCLNFQKCVKIYFQWMLKLTFRRERNYAWSLIDSFS